MKKTQITKEQVSIYRTVNPLFYELYKEVSLLAKKKPDGTLNKTKVSLLNRILQDLKSVLENEDHAKYLDLLDEDMLPQYSDVLLIMSQYKAALEKFSSRYHYKDTTYGDCVWHYTPRDV